MIIVKKKGHNSQIYIARSNAAIDKTNVEEDKVYVSEWDLYRILGDYIKKSELKADFDAKQDKLVSGENIKTINGNDILGEGDLWIETSNTVELTQAEYDEMVANGTVDEDTIYMISDAAVEVPYPTYNEMVEYVDDILGQIDEIMKDIIG